MVTKDRRHNRLVIDTGIGHHDAHSLAGGNETTFQAGHLFCLAKRLITGQVNTARVGNHRDLYFCTVCGHLFGKRYPSLTKGFRVSHHMGLTDADHIFSIKHLANLQLVLNRPLYRGSGLSGQHGLFFVTQLHVHTALLY